MPRNMSFSLTTNQIRNKTKTVTRRLGWWHLRSGDIVNACVKCMGLKKGEKIQRICQIRIVSVRAETLCNITKDDVKREGFPDWSVDKFVRFFCKTHTCSPLVAVNRIEFEYI